MRLIDDLRAEYSAALRADGRQCVDGTPTNVRLFGNTVTVGECWEYLGARQERTGHGRFARPDGRVHGAHRVAYELAHGRVVPDGMCVLHHCDNPPCINPAHLWLGTYADNNHDRDAKGRTRNQYTGKLTSVPDLADALHLGGNGLVPQAARAAWELLTERLES